MPKTTKAQKRAQSNYMLRLKESGKKRVYFILKPEWIIKVREYIKELEGK